MTRTFIRRCIRMPAEALLVLGGMLAIPLLPRRAVVACARGLGWAVYRCNRGLRRVACANLDAAYGDTLSAARKQAIARGAFTAFALLTLDLFWFGAFTRRRIARYVVCDASVDELFRTAPLVAVTGHLGNWEVHGLALAFHGAPLLSVATESKSKVADLYLMRVRQATGQRLTRRVGAVRALVRELRRGGRVALLLDQNTTEEEGGEFVDFFGLPVCVSKVTAALCARTGAKFMVCWCIPNAAGVYRAAVTHAVAVGADGVAEAATTRTVTRMLEDVIRRHPEHWLWMYKRWKYIPPGADAARFPFYARPSSVK